MRDGQNVDLLDISNLHMQFQSDKFDASEALKSNTDQWPRQLEDQVRENNYLNGSTTNNSSPSWKQPVFMVFVLFPLIGNNDF